MSHEIRTPLNAIIGFSELLESKEASQEEVHKYTHDIKQTGVSLLNLINDMLDLSEIISNKISITPEDTDIQALCTQLAVLYEPKVTEKGLTMELCHTTAIPHCMIDSRRLRQILLNIIGNAVKFTNQGSISVSLSFVKIDETHGTLSIAVSDTGVGMPADKYSIIFEPLIQDEDTRNILTKPHTGLGLAIVRRLMVHMKGTVTVKSKLGEGSTFTLSFHGLTYKDAPETAEKRYEKNSVFGNAPQEKKMSLLLVDDIDLNLKVLSAVATKLGFTCKCTNSAKEAIAALEEATESPAWVLTDLWMPEMNGGELAALIRKNQAWGGIKIAAVTADTENLHSIDMSVFDKVIQKPITQSSLKKNICAE